MGRRLSVVSPVLIVCGHQIVLCSNKLRREVSAVETLVHEMVHVYDHHRAKVDWGNCIHRACSEVQFGLGCLRVCSFSCVFCILVLSTYRATLCHSLSVFVRHVATQTSQIRAANLSGDCAFVREFERFAAQSNYSFPIFKQQQACVRRRALLSCQGAPGCDNPEAAVEAAWATCYEDTAPFPRPP